MAILNNLTGNTLSKNRKDRSMLLMIFPSLPVVILMALLYWYEPQGTLWVTRWVPGLDISLSFRLDGLSFLFACLISGIGALVQIYAVAYLRDSASRFSFHLFLTLFMFAMLGLVTSNNILLLFVFWELTTVTSYLLIGFNHEKANARKNALQSLIVTGAGGLALLAGLIFLGQMAGSYELNIIVARAEVIAEHEWFTPSLILILLGAFTKSAQFPFHFWLPNAMAAPTPVSAYLHSATMVKAGIYLLMRLSPVFSNSEVWFYSLTICGGFTAIWCALLALRQTDLKLMLAYSTNVALGKLMLLTGIGTALSISAALLFILAHSFYKASLFMVVGNIDRATGTRDIRALTGLKTVLSMSFFIALMGALSKSGVPPFMGFLSKEYMYKSGLEVGGWVTGALFITNIMMAALAMVFVAAPFFSPHQGRPAPVKKVESAKGLWMPAMCLGLGSLIVPLLGLGWINSNVVAPGVSAVLPGPEPVVAELWQGVNLPLLLSVATLALGYVVYRFYPVILSPCISVVPHLPPAESVFDQMMKGIMRFAKWQTQVLQNKRLSHYILLFFVVLACVMVSRPLSIPTERFTALADVSFYEVTIALLLILAALICVFSTSRLLAVSALGVTGFMTTLVFMLYSAPDVAKTLLLVESLMVVFVVLFLRHMPKLTTVANHPVRRRLLHGMVGGVIGLSVAALLISVTSKPLDSSLADFFVENSLPGGYGRNIVNVILVDFRAFDTLGEVVVVVMAGVASVNLLKTHYHKRNRIQSLIFATTAHIVAALMLVFSLYLLLRGHNEPGGGFIGALIAVIGFALLMFAESPEYVRERLHYPPLVIALSGVSLSLVAGLMSLAFNLPFLTGLWWKEFLPLGTPLIFDAGIYLAVIGGVMSVLLRVNEELD